MQNVWKYIASIAIAILITLGASWLSLNEASISRAEVVEMVQPDREMLRDTRDEVRSLRNEIGNLSREIGELKGMLGK